MYYFYNIINFVHLSSVIMDKLEYPKLIPRKSFDGKVIIYSIFVEVKSISLSLTCRFENI